jgi:hypothetical protein
MPQTTFYKRNLMQFKNKAVRSFKHGMAWYRDTTSKVRDINEAIDDWGEEKVLIIALIIGSVLFLGITILFIGKKFKDIDKINIESILSFISIIGEIVRIAAASFFYGIIVAVITTPIVLLSLKLVTGQAIL